MNHETPLRGVFPIAATPFQDDDSVDLEDQLRLTDYLLEQGAHGLGLFGNAGEGYALLPEERVTLLKAIAKRVDGRAPLVVGAGATGTAAAVRLCREAEDFGAAALMVLPPYLLRPDADGLFRHFEEISRAVAIPIMIQDAPLLTQVPMPPALLGRMAREIEHVRYAKVEAPPTAPKVSRVFEASEGALEVFGGLNGQFMIEEMGRGAIGTMPASDMTAMYVAVWDRLQKRDLEGAWETFTRALPLIRFELQPGMGVSAVKHNLMAKGVLRSARVRHPTVSLDARSLAELAMLRKRVTDEGA